MFHFRVGVDRLVHCFHGSTWQRVVCLAVHVAVFNIGSMGVDALSVMSDI